MLIGNHESNKMSIKSAQIFDVHRYAKHVLINSEGASNRIGNGLKMRRLAAKLPQNASSFNCQILLISDYSGLQSLF